MLMTGPLPCLHRSVSSIESALKSWVHNLIHDVAKIGWNNLPDMPLSIMLTKARLSDIGQDIIFDGKSKINHSVMYRH